MNYACDPVNDDHCFKQLNDLLALAHLLNDLVVLFLDFLVIKGHLQIIINFLLEILNSVKLTAYKIIQLLVVYPIFIS